jgi:transposase
VRNDSVWRALLGVGKKTVIEGLDFDEDQGMVVARVHLTRSARGRCGRCQRRCPGYDSGSGRRRWRALDLGTTRAFLEADSPRVSCPEHGVVVASVPWARHDAGHTHAFDDQTAWLAVACSKTAVTKLMRIAWRTVGKVITRVLADLDADLDRLEGLRRIGIDEISYKRGHRYLLVVVDHDTRRLVWAAPGRDKATLNGFFDQLGTQRSAAITHVSADSADWIAQVVARRAVNAVQCADAFHVVAWATEALDAVRRQAWNDARALARTEPRRSPGQQPNHAPPRPGHDLTRAYKNARWALWKNPENLTENQIAKLAWITKTDPRLYRAYLLKEGLRHVFVVKGEEGKQALDRWLSWARRSRLPSFVRLAQRIVKYRASIEATLEHDLSNALVESTNTKIRLLTRIAFGFHSPEALIALIMLSLGGHRPALPGRSAA